MGLLLYSIFLVTLLVILWRVSSVAKYVIKMTIFTLAGLFGCIFIPIMLFRPRDSRNALFGAAVLRASCRILGLKLRVEGHENIVKNGGSIVLMNHQSSLDLIVLACLWPVLPNSTVISKKEIFYLQPFGLASWLWGTIFIDRTNKQDAQKQVNQTAEIVKKREARVLMFPEGTRNNKKTLLPFKKGAFHLAITSQCPIQPVAVARFNFLGNYRFDSGHIRIKILPPISTKDKTVDDLEDLITESYTVLSKNIDLLSSPDEERNANYKVKSN